MRQILFSMILSLPCSLFSNEKSFYSAITFDQTNFRNQNISGIYSDGSIQIPWTNSYQPSRKLGFGISLGYTINSLKHITFEFESSYRTKSESALQIKNQPDLGRYSLEYFTVGTTARFDKIYGLGIGVDFRREALGISPYSIPGSVNPSEATQVVYINRPWAMISYEYTHKNTSQIYPFISIRACYALTSFRAPSAATQSTVINSSYMTTWTQNFARSLAPTFQLVFQSGLRF